MLKNQYWIWIQRSWPSISEVYLSTIIQIFLWYWLGKMAYTLFKCSTFCNCNFTLGTRTIPYLSQSQQKMEDFASKENEASVIVIKNSLAAFDSLFESIPQFMRSYLPRVIRFASTSYSGYWWVWIIGYWSWTFNDQNSSVYSSPHCFSSYK